MSLTARLRRLRNIPGVLKARHLAEVTVTPHLRGHLEEVRAGAAETRNMTEHLARHAADNDAQLAELNRSMPAVLNAITSTHGIGRMAQREMTSLRVQVDDLARRIDESNMPAVAEIQARLDALDDQLPRIDRLEEWVVARTSETEQIIELWRSDLAPHVETLSYLLSRVEMIRAETLQELRYGPQARGNLEQTTVETKIINHGSLTASPLKLNLGCGHIPMKGFVNIDFRELPDVDVVAPLDHIPVQLESVDEIFSSHVLEHFPREQLARTLLPYWFGLLREGGRFSAVVPDIDAMSRAYAVGEMSFTQFREVLYGGQEYEGDTHFNGFSAPDLMDLLEETGFSDIELVASGRPNGACLELEVTAIRRER